MRLYPPGTHFTAESTEAMQIKSLAQGENILMLGFELSTFCIQNRHSNHYTNCSFLRKAHSTEHPTRGCPRLVLISQQSTEAMRIKCLSKGHNILMPGFEPSTSVSRNRHSNHMTNMLHWSGQPPGNSCCCL